MADHASSHRRRGRLASPNLTALLILVLLAAGALLWKQPWAGEAPSPAFPDRPRQQLAAQFAQLSRAPDQSGYSHAAQSSSFGRRLWQARGVLDITAATFEYVRGATAADRSDGTALALVQVTWTEGPHSLFGRGNHATTVGVRVRPDGDGFAMLGVEPIDRAVPPWLAGTVSRSRGDGVDLVRLDGGGSDLLLRELELAVAAVRSVVPQVSASLVVLAPQTVDQTASLVGQQASDISQIAAVTTRLGGTAESASAIVLNPEQFSTMDAHAQQVVLTHEATHQLTNAVGSGGESWVIEGFADFVALHNDKRPVTENAGQALGAIRQDGPPKALPSRSDFANSAQGLGALYEATWLIFRMLGERYGDAAVTQFYGAVLGGTPVEEALADAFDTNTAQVTRDWQAYLSKLAG